MPLTTAGEEEKPLLAVETHMIAPVLALRAYKLFAPM